MKKLIKRILKEETEVDQKEIVQDMVNDFGFQNTLKYLGGIDNFLDIMYDGDIMKFSEDSHLPLVYMPADGMLLYLHEILVEKLKLGDYKYGKETQQILGKFRFGSKNGMQYAFEARAKLTTIHGQPYYKVIGMSGDSGFGYNGITQRNTLGKRYRQQIFKQIIDKYDLEPYMKVKTF